MVVIQQNHEKVRKAELVKSLDEFVASEGDLVFGPNQILTNISFSIHHKNQEHSEYIGVMTGQPRIIVSSEKLFPYARNLAEFLEKKGVNNFYEAQDLDTFYKLQTPETKGQFVLLKDYA